MVTFKILSILVDLCNTECCTMCVSFLLDFRRAETDKGHYDCADNGREKHKSNVNDVAF